MNSAKSAADGEGFKADAEVGGQLAAVVDGAGGGIGAGHADADHILRAEGFGGDGGHQGRVDAAAQAYEGLAKAAFAHVIARAQNQGAVGGLGVVVFGNRHGRRVEGVDDDQVFLERGGLRNQLAARIEGQRGAVEDEAVVAAHLVRHQHRNRVAAGDSGQHLAPDGSLGVPKRR